MKTLSFEEVLDELVEALAEQRMRNAGYAALARAILAEEPIETEQREANAA